MSVSIVIEVFIGLFFMYFVLSTLVSAINELIQNLFLQRSRTLAQFILETFTPAPTKSAQQAKPIRDLARRLFRAFVPPPPQPTQEAENYAKSFYKSSYVKTKKSSISLMRPRVENSKTVTSIPSGNFAQAILEAIGFSQQIYQDSEAALAALKAIIATLPAASPLRDVLTDAVNQAEEKISNVVLYLEKWFDEQMAQLSDIYKRWAQLFLFIIGLAIALYFNINSLAIAKTLATNPTLRETVVAQASTLVQNNNPNAPQSSLTCGTQTFDSTKADAAVNYTKCEIDLMALPVGWSGGIIFPKDAVQYQNENALVGILITALAASLGAPFWYDLIKMLIGMRSSGSK